MPNNIELFAGYAGLLDEKYAQVSVTSCLDGANELVTNGAHINEIIVPTMQLSGLSDYNRDTGYAPGSVALVNQTIVCNYDRGRMFSVDAIDDAQTAGVAFGRLASEFLRLHVAPELDAFRLAEYANNAGAMNNGDISDGPAVLSAIREAINAMDDAQVTMEGRVLFITSRLLGHVEDMDTTRSRAVLDRFESVVPVHSSRFYNDVYLNNISEPLEHDGGFTPANNARYINFLAIQKDAVLQFTRHAKPKVIEPDANQTADAWKFGYRIVSLAKVMTLKAAGVYAHLSDTLA